MGVLKGICVSMKYMALGKSRQQGFWIINCIAEFSKQKVKNKKKIWNQKDFINVYMNINKLWFICLHHGRFPDMNRIKPFLLIMQFADSSQTCYTFQKPSENIE